MVYYVRNGKQCVRRYGIPGKKRKKGNSQAKREANVRFGTTQAYYKYFCEKVSADIWRSAAAAQGMMPHNLFFSVNSRYFGMDEEGNGVLVDCERFRFAEGELPEGRNGGAHVYLYFMREDGTAFSPSAYFINDSRGGQGAFVEIRYGL